MFLTPTYIGALLAGAAFWCLFWVTASQIGRNPASKALVEIQPVPGVD
jgi:hypothetical protein